MHEITVIKPGEVAKRLNKSLQWVYRNAGALGAVRIGRSWIFTEEGLCHAIQGKRDVEGESHQGRPALHVLEGNKRGSAGLGKRKEERIKGELKDRHGVAV